MKDPERPYFVVIQDDEDDRFFLREAFLQCGCPYDLVEFADGVSFLDYLDQQPQTTAALNSPWLVILDLDLSSAITGVATLKAIRRHGFWKQLPVIAVTGVLDRELERTVRKLGVTDYVQKPSTVRELEYYAHHIYRRRLDEYILKRRLHEPMTSQRATPQAGLREPHA